MQLLEEIRSDILTLEKKVERLLVEIIWEEPR